jgi:hypothetical protein
MLSREDTRLTRQLVEASRLMDLRRSLPKAYAP